MISEKDIAFLQYWEQVREKENTFTSKISGGLPMAFLFALPIILSGTQKYLQLRQAALLPSCLLPASSLFFTVTSVCNINGK